MVWVFCLFLSLLFLSIGTKSSPLYPFNDWVDVNASFTMGKAMMNGKVLYRDIFDQRGPFFYFLFGLTYLISSTDFLGVFLLEVISFSAFLFFCFKLLSLFLDINYSLIALPLISASIINLKSFSHGGSPEQLCLPLVTISLYYLFAYFKRFYSKPIPKCWILINGIIAGSILWIKFSLLGFWFGWIIAILIGMLINKQIREALYTSLLFISGMIVVTIPWVIYFGLNRSLGECLNSYFVINIFTYTETGTLLEQIKLVIKMFLMHLLMNPFIVGHLFLGLLIFFIKKRSFSHSLSKLGLFLCFIFLIMSVYGGGRGYIYYFLIFAPFIIFGFIVLLAMVNDEFGTIHSKKTLNLILTSIVITLFIYALVFGQNTDMLMKNKGELVQYKYSKIINKKNNATLLNYGSLDGGFYTTTGIVPNVRFFQSQNINEAKFPLVMEEQNRYIQDKVVDFIVIRVPSLLNVDDIEVPNLDKNYKLIEKERQPFEGKEYYYLLFKKLSGFYIPDSSNT